MNKKLIVVLICVLLSAGLVVSATGIMSADSYKSNENQLSISSLSKDSIKEEKKIHKQDDILPKPSDIKTGFLSIPIAAFLPRDNIMTYKINGLWITGSGYFFTPVYLPDGVTITKLTFYWVDKSGESNGELWLMESPINGTHSSGWSIISYGNDSNLHSSVDDKIELKIDNSKNSYHLELLLDNNIYCYNVQIEYTYKTKGDSANTFEGQQLHEHKTLSSR